MTIVAKFPRSFAILLALLTVTPVLPLVAAEHTSDDVPDAPPLGHARPGDTCIGLGVQPQVLATVNGVATMGTGYFAYDRDVPALCGLQGPVDGWASLVRQADAILDNYRNVSRELQRQADQRVETTIPDGYCQPDDNLSYTTRGLHCGITRPQYVVMDDHFDDRRLGGFGEWTVITEKGEADAWRRAVTKDANGTVNTWRFGDSTGYARGVHQWLVSPELDYTATSANAFLATQLRAAMVTAINQVTVLCNAPVLVPQVGVPNPAYLALCGPEAALGTQELVNGYVAQIESDTHDLPLGQEAIGLDIVLRNNLATGIDGVRVWAYVGDRAPTRPQLTDLNFGSGRTAYDCAYEETGRTVIAGVAPAVSNSACVQITTAGGAKVLTLRDAEGRIAGQRTTAFQDRDRVANPTMDRAFTGDQRDSARYHVDMTEFAGQRVWLVFEVRSTPDTGRGESFFDDRGMFPRQDGSFGFELSHVRSTADGYVRNFRLKDAAQTFLPMPANNEWNDPTTTRATVPPGTAPIIVRVHNAGTFAENATLSVRIEERPYAGTVLLDDAIRQFGVIPDIPLRGVRPSEVREVRVPWPAATTEGNLYIVTAHLEVNDREQLPSLTNTTEYANPNVTAVRPPNAAGRGIGGAVDATGTVRAFTDHHLTPVRVSPGSGPALEVCKNVGVRGCDALPTAQKGDRRILLLGVRNDGSAPEDVSAVLDLSLDGVDKSTAIVDDAVKKLNDIQPGETRAVQWTLAPADGGVYLANVAFLLANGTPAAPLISRFVYVQRSPGVICFDNAADARECAPAFTASQPDILRDQDITTAYLAPDGTLYATTTVTAEAGGLYARAAGSDAWAQLANISYTALIASLGERSDGLGYASIRAITLAADGTLHLVGDNATAIARAPSGTLRLVPFEPFADPPRLVATTSGAPTFDTGITHRLVGGALGGATTEQAPYQYRWSVLGAPAGSTGAVLANETEVFANFTPDVEGVFIVQLNVTDAEGAYALSNATLTSRIGRATCHSGDGIVSRNELLDVAAAAEARGNASAVLCLRANSTPASAAKQNLGDLELFLDLKGLDAKTGMVTYRVRFVSGDADIATDITVTYTVSTTATGTTRTVNAKYGPSGALTAPAFLIPGTSTIKVTLRREHLAAIGENSDASTLALTVDNADTLPQGNYVFGQDVNAPPRVTGLAARPAPRDGHAVVLRWDAVPGVENYTILRAPSAMEPFVEVAVTQATSHTDGGLTRGHEFVYTVVATDKAGNMAAAAKPVTAAAARPFPAYTDITSYSDTLWASASGGTMYWLNATSQRFERVELTITDAAPYKGDVRALLAHDGRLYAVGELGAVFTNEGAPNASRRGWNHSAVIAGGRDLRALETHRGQLYAAGAKGALVRLEGSDWKDVAAPAYDAGTPDIVDIFEAKTGALFALDSAGRLATCASCSATDPAWTFPEFPIPSIHTATNPVRARVTTAVSEDGVTVLLGEGGVVLDYITGSVYKNSGDWTTVPSLVAHDGTVLEGSTNLDGNYSIRLTVPGNVSAESWSQARIRMNHHVANAHPRASVSVRLFYDPYPTYSTAPTHAITQGPTCSEKGFGAGAAVFTSCNVSPGTVLWSQNFTQRTTTDGWSEFVAIVPPPSARDGSVALPSTISGIEFMRENSAVPPALTRWAIDDATLEINTGTPQSPEWKTIAAWYGRDSPKNIGRLGPFISVSQTTNRAVTDVDGSALIDPWLDTITEPFGLERRSAWHLSSTIADRPVWVLNDEALASTTKPRIRDSWDTRLVSPIIDLSDSYEPVLTFRHAYAFRTSVTTGAQNQVIPGDGGWVEVQYLKVGAECGSTDPTVTCWSRFYKVNPLHVNGSGIVTDEYPNPKEMGYAAFSRSTGTVNAFNDSWGPADLQTQPWRASHSWWDRSVIPSPSKVVEDARRVDDYRTETFRLTSATNKALLAEDRWNPVPVNVSGRMIRVAFHAMTNPTGSTTFHPTAVPPTTFEGEGWYITDFKVKGASELGIDLRATNMTFRTGYSPFAIGVGPATTVPINVTIENRGIYDVGGFTGELEVRRIVDPVSKLTERVALLPLAQQPELRTDQSTNVTFLWDVPATPDEDYVLTFVAKPIGIARDEDPTDNVAALGTIAKPILAKASPSFAIKFQVTPENATTDITRYVPIFIDNTGNVPLSRFVVGRDITVLKGVLTSKLESREWRTNAVVPPGTRVALQAVSDSVDPVNDLFWKAPERSSFLFEVTATGEYGDVVLSSQADRRISAFATYLFDDIEAGPRGESTRGEWTFDSAWAQATPGFRSSLAYTFGDPGIPRYAADADASAVSPPIDLSGARSARLGFYTRYQLEKTFDAGDVEASVDGGKTWTQLTPSTYLDPEGKKRPGYNESPLSAASGLHLTHDPAQPTFAFTGDTRESPGNVDGWIYREFDLTEYINITQQNVPYERFDASALSSYVGSGLKDVLGSHPNAGANNYYDQTWTVGDISDYRYWEFQNLTEDVIRSPTGSSSFWWSGSASLADDGRRISDNPMLRIPAQPVLDAVEEDDTVIVDWWEWVARYNGADQTDKDGVPASDIATNFRWQSAVVSQAHRINVSTPSVIERRGQWYHLQADITSLTMPADGKPVEDFQFIYSPIKQSRALTAVDLWASSRYVDTIYNDDRGFAIDGFHVRAHKLVGGLPTNERTLLSTQQAWDLSLNQVCLGNVAYGDARVIPCANMGVLEPRQPPARVLRDENGNALVAVSGPSVTLRSLPGDGPVDAIEDAVADFERSGVKPGEKVFLRNGSHSESWATIVGVAPHRLTLATPLFLADQTAYAIATVPTVGTAWSVVPVMPGIPTSWHVEDVRDISNYSARAPLPTGETPRAWYTGPACTNNAGADPGFEVYPAGGGVFNVHVDAADGLYHRDSIYQNIHDFREKGVRVGDVIFFGNGHALQAYHPIITAVEKNRIKFEELPTTVGSDATFTVASRRSTCLLPSAESRLVTPSLDLAKVAGATAFLDFEHRYAFANSQIGLNEDPFASGGVIELQEFDAQTRTWLPWKQIYSDVESLFRLCEPTERCACPPNDACKANIGPLDNMTHAIRGYRGGYTAYTVNQTNDGTGRILRNEAPFEAHPNGGDHEVQYLYSGKSSRPSDSSYNWTRERYDLSDYIGKKVRIGFHVALTNADRGTQGGNRLVPNPATYADPDGAFQELDPLPNLGGWWITNVSITGKVLAGAPVQLRFHAATDGNVDDGYWQLDDLGVFGSRYGRNVGIFVNESPGAFGALAGNTTAIPITLRNLGDTVRRDLAVRIQNLPSDVNPLFADAGNAPRNMTEKGVITLYGYSLAPGQSATVLVNVTLPRDLPKSVNPLEFYVKALECASGPRDSGTSSIPCGEAAGDEFVSIADNEVQGFLARNVRFVAMAAPIVNLTSPATLPVAPRLGDTIDVSVLVSNHGFAQVTLDLACSGVVNTEHAFVNHHSDPEERFVGTTFPCVLTETDLTLAQGASRRIRFQATPTVSGFASLRISGDFLYGLDKGKLAPLSITVPVGVSSVLMADDFTPLNAERAQPPINEPAKGDLNIQQNWTWSAGEGGTPPKYTYPTGHERPGAMLLGIRSDLMTGTSWNYAAAGCAGTYCAAVSRPVDLHNFTSEHITLSFWHLPQFAYGDGGRVQARVLLDETRPNVAESYGPPCTITPRGGYTGVLWEYVPAERADDTVRDTNGIDETEIDGRTSSFMVPRNGVPGFFTGYHEEWSRAVFDLAEQAPCKDAAGNNVTLIGHTVRFFFKAYVGMPEGQTLKRGTGRGWLIDDIVVGGQGIELRPESQPIDGKTPIVLLDNTTKAFNIIVRNTGSYPDIVRFSFDEYNSSTPPNSVLLPQDQLLAPGETRIVQAHLTLPRDPSLLPTKFKARIVGTSLVDPSAYATTDIEVVFAPRQLAELVVSAAAPKGVVQEGTETFIPITVENNGLVASVPSTVRIVDTWATGEQVTELDLPSMASYFQDADDASRVLDLRYRPPRGSIGPHTLTITVDPQVLGQEYTRVNNVVVLPIPVSELLIPDVDVASAGSLKLRDSVGLVVDATRDADLTRYEIAAGELATFEVVVKNLGRAGATNVNVRMFIGSLSLPPKTIPYIAPDSQVVLTFNWLAQKGEYSLKVDALSEQVELSSANNHNPALGVTQLIVKGYEVKVQLAAIDGIIEPGADLKVPFNITNVGNAGEELKLVAKAPEGWTVELPRATFFLRAGETYSSTASLHVPADAVAGEQLISILAVARQNPMKAASASTPANVRAFYGGSIVTTEIEAAPPKLLVPVKLSNEGNSLDPWSVTVRLPPGWIADETLPAKVVVPAHGEATLDLHVKVPETTAPGDRLITVKATMPNGEVRDGTLRVSVLPFRSAAVTVADATPRETQGALAYAVTVENAGNVASPFSMVMLNTGPGLAVSVTPSTFTLEPGAKALATLVVKPNASLVAGSYAIPAYTLFSGVQPDSAEGRSNQQRLVVSVIRPDLRAGQLEYAPRTDVTAGERIVVKVPITNRGEGTVTDMPVHLFVDDLFVGETRLVTLAPGETRDVTLNWTAIPGQHTLSAVLDPYADSVDAVREDNAVSALVQVKTASIVGGLTGGARVPGFESTFLFMAAVAAVLALAARRRTSR